MLLPAASPAFAPEELELFRVAAALRIPWARLLEREIDAERTLRRFLGDPGEDLPLWRLLSVLPATALESWRVRARLEGLVREARASSPTALRSAREAMDEMCGRRPDETADRGLAMHWKLAYERVRELARLARLAERSRGGRAERLDVLVATSGATRADAAWAVDRADGPGRGHATDDAMRQARTEGFEIPRADSELRAFRLLRSLSRSKITRRRVPKRGAAASPGALPRAIAS